LHDWCEEHNAWADTAAQPRAAAESLVTISHSIQPFWLKFQAIAGGDVPARFYEAFHFDDTNQLQMSSHGSFVSERSERLLGWRGPSQRPHTLRRSNSYSPAGFARATLSAIARNHEFSLHSPTTLSVLLVIDSDRKFG